MLSGTMALGAKAQPAQQRQTRRHKLVPRIVFVAVVLIQLGFIVRGYWDPHKHFAFQPFNEWDLWRADIVRVTYRGKRIAVQQPWHGYSWTELIGGDRGLDRPTEWQPASSGIRSILVFLQEALNYAATHTPDDPETHHYEATVYYTHNSGPEQVVTLTSEPHAVVMPEAR